MSTHGKSLKQRFISNHDGDMRKKLISQNEVWKEFKPICHTKVINLRKSYWNLTLPTLSVLTELFTVGIIHWKRNKIMWKKEENLEKHLLPKSSAFNSIFIILLRSNSLEKLQLAFVIFVAYGKRSAQWYGSNLLANCCLTVGQQLVTWWLSVGQQLTDSRFRWALPHNEQ